MTSTPPGRAATRSGGDRCPGALSPFVSADGAIVRLRLPGGWVATAVLRRVSELAARWGDPRITLTSRGSVQVRGLPDPQPAELVAGLAATGTIPSDSHERARNIVADPLEPDLRPVVDRLDAALLARPELAALPGRFLLAVARPGGPALGTPHDVALVVDPGERTAHVVTAGRAWTGPLEEAVVVLTEALTCFLRLRPDERTWNIADLDEQARAAVLPEACLPRPGVAEVGAPPAPGRHGDALVAHVPLGLLEPAHVAALADVAPEVQVTPWRSIVVPTAAEHAAARLAEVGLVLDPTSPWTVVSACTGAPGCARTDVPTQDIARASEPGLDPDGPPVHVIGCERACGHPSRPYVQVLRPASAAQVTAAQRSATPTRTR